MFSTNYPPWDFDNPQHVLEFQPSEQQKRLLRDNAKALYGLGSLPMTMGARVTLGKRPHPDPSGFDDREMPSPIVTSRY
jgi:hypothetical protein